jgi:hypothetical protein
LLLEKAGLPKALENAYEVNAYPKAQLPKRETVEAVLDWMASAVPYDDLVWKPPTE